ncbi:MAG TPA: alpha/beta fold hydrolase [Baekduia sp.]|nr:alpha/beta fold hydrolase [Baekduia sp.]
MLHLFLAGRPLGSLRRWLAVVTVSLCALGATAGTASAAYPIGGVADAAWHFTFDPDDVPGANHWLCRPSSAHPYPVVLVHATFVNFGTNWVDLAPRLKNAGYCVYALNYGMAWYSAFGRIGGVDDIAGSARELRDFVNTVLFWSGASKVDLVGHSQGGMMPSYYLKNLGGASKVHAFVGIAPSNHGTTLNGLTTALPQAWGGLGADVMDVMLDLVGQTAPGLTEQVQGSAFQTALFGSGDTVPGPRYTVIQTKYDKVVTPYTNAFLSGSNVRNILVQDLCPNDPVGHVGMFDDYPTMQLVMNALGANSSTFKPVCSSYGLPL